VADAAFAFDEGEWIVRSPPGALRISAASPVRKPFAPDMMFWCKRFELAEADSAGGL